MRCVDLNNIYIHMTKLFKNYKKHINNFCTLFQYFKYDIVLIKYKSLIYLIIYSI